MNSTGDNKWEANKTDAGNGSKAVCRVSNVLRSPWPDPGRWADSRRQKTPDRRLCDSAMTILHVGGVVAIGFSGQYMLVISHSGSGLYESGTWQRIARDAALNYPENGNAKGIGPIAGKMVSVVELNYLTEELNTFSPDGRFQINYSDGAITIKNSAQLGDAPEPGSSVDPALRRQPPRPGDR